MVHSDFVCNSEENGAGQKVLLKTAAYFQAYRLKKKQFTIECRRFSKQNGDLKAIDAGLVICEGKLKRSFSTTKKKKQTQKCTDTTANCKRYKHLCGASNSTCISVPGDTGGADRYCSISSCGLIIADGWHIYEQRQWSMANSSMLPVVFLDASWQQWVIKRLVKEDLAVSAF